MDVRPNIVRLVFDGLLVAGDCVATLPIGLPKSI
jgi:hypothetical protein